MGAENSRSIIPIIIPSYIFSTTVIRTYITGLAGTSLMGSATGFFYERNGNKFLITNRHVIISEERDLYPDYLVIKVHTSSTSMIQNRDINIVLYEKKTPIWLEHQRLKDVDVVAIPVEPYIASGDVIHYWSARHLPPSNVTINVGESLIIIGYPMEFYDRRHNLPIIRNGTVASTFGAHFEGRPLFLVDANLHPGTSGSPVIAPIGISGFTDEGPIILREFPSLLGINSGEYSIDNVNLGLNAVWYSNLIEEIVNRAS